MHRLVIALTTLIGLTGAAYVAGYLFLGAGETGAGDLVPADAAMYLSVSLQPSPTQHDALAELASRLPGFADISAFDQKVDELAQSLAAQAGIDYRADVRPWLGDELSVVALPGDEGSMVLLAAVADSAAAEEAAGRIEDKAGATFESASYGGTEIREGDSMAYAFVASTLVAGDAAGVRAVIDVAGGAASLADREGLSDAMATLPADRIGTAYVDLEAAFVDGSRYPFAVGALMAESGGLVARGRTGAVGDPAGASPTADADATATLPAWMPADTQLAISTFDGAELLLSAESLLADVPAAEGITETLDSVRLLFTFGLGVDLDDLLVELLRGEGALAVRGLDTDAPTGVLLLRPDDIGAVTARLDELVGLLTDAGGSVDRTDLGEQELVTVGLAGIASLTYVIADDVVILALEEEGVTAALEAQQTGNALADLATYRGAFELAGERTGNEVYMEPEVLVALLGMGDGLPGDVRDILAQLGAVAVTLPDRGDHLEFHAVLTVE
jgi:Protein of unknown function (DUF3352)